MNLRDQAKMGVLHLEEGTGLPLSGVPVGQRDQYCAMVRDTFLSVGVDLGDKEQANAAFIGAHVTLSTLMTQGPMALVSASHLLRYLMDRADGGKARASIWARTKMKVARWLMS